MISESIFWVVFGVVILALLIFDLEYINRRAHAISMKEASLMTIFYVVISLIFAAGISLLLGVDKSFEFLTAYILEKSLSVDNLFVFLTIFTYFNVNAKYQHRILFWGILGALITRGIFIFVGIAAINMFHFVLYIMGLFLIYTGIKVGTSDDDKPVDPSKNFVLTKLSKHLPLKKDYKGSEFFTKHNSSWFMTPLFIVLLVIESTDVMFSVDSVPAVLSVTSDTFVAYTSNIFAILGLRSLYFVIAQLMPKFDYLKYGLAFVLSFIGVKMLIGEIYKIPTSLSLLVVAGVLAISIIASVMKNKSETSNIKEDTNV